jgi:PAS domain S-box-containing protein
VVPPKSQIERELSLAKAAAERAERLGGLLALSYEPMFMWQINGPIEFWNAGAERFYGFTREEAIGKSSHALLQTKFPVEFTKWIAQLQNELHWSGELRHICKDGREVIVESRQQLLDDGTVIEVNRDVTERNQIEAARRQTEEQLGFLAAIVQSSDDAIVSKNLDGIITTWNKGAERVFGYTAEEAVGQPITIVIPQDRQNEENTILARIRRGERIDHFETVRQRKHGSLIWVSLTISPVRNAEGKVIGASKIARDITEQKRTSDLIATLAREAEHRSKNLLANVQAMVNLSQADAVADLKKAIEGRIHALANVHSLFITSRWVGAELSTIALQELAPYSATRERRVRVEGPQVVLEPDTAQAVAVALHELATNAAKYGAFSTANGYIDLKWSHDANGRLNLRWIETGGPIVQPPTRIGFGRRVIEQMITQLKGESRFEWRAEGLVCEITLRV